VRDLLGGFWFDDKGAARRAFGSDRGELPAAAQGAAGREPAAVAGRGGLAAAAAFHERAAGLTLDPARRAQRALAAALAKHAAGAPDAALELLATAEAGPLDELERARVDLLGAQIVALSRGSDGHGRVAIGNRQPDASIGPTACIARRAAAQRSSAVTSAAL
jgi:hypothetical protein